MKTPSHMLIGHLLSRLLPGPAVGRSGCAIAGAAAPGFPLIAVAVSCWMASACADGLASRTARFVDLVDGFYCDSQVFIALHHLLHAPLSLTLLAGAWLVYGRTVGRHDYRGLWFLAGAASHALVDLVCHSRDGILLFWPWSWSYRFDAGVDQWDMAGAGLVLIVVEGSPLVIYGTRRLWAAMRPFYVFLRIPSAA